MKTLFVAYRVTDLGRSLEFYTSLGYIEMGWVAGSDGDRLVILKFPDEPVATLELVHRPGGGRVEVGSGFDHLAIQMDTLAATVDRLTSAGLEPEPVQHPAGPDGPEDVVADRPGRLPDRVGGVATRTSRWHHRSGLRLTRRAAVATRSAPGAGVPRPATIRPTAAAHCGGLPRRTGTWHVKEGSS